MAVLAVLRVVSMSGVEPADPEALLCTAVRPDGCPTGSRELLARIQLSCCWNLPCSFLTPPLHAGVGIKQMCPLFLPCRSRQVLTARPAQVQEVRDIAAPCSMMLLVFAG